MQNIKFTYTRDQTKANKWDLNLKFISSQDDIFYTARIFFRDSSYFQTLFASEFKENKDNTLILKLDTITLEKYFQILNGKNEQTTFTDQELIDLVEIGDQQQLKPLLEPLLEPLVEREMITAEDLFRLIEYYDLEFNLDVNNLIHLDGISNHLDHLEEPMVWDCFYLACSNLRLFKIHETKEKTGEELEKYKKLSLACYDRLPDKAMLFRKQTKNYLHNTILQLPNSTQRREVKDKLKQAGLFEEHNIVDFRKELESCLDIILNL